MINIVLSSEIHKLTKFQINRSTGRARKINWKICSMMTSEAYIKVCKNQNCDVIMLTRRGCLVMLALLLVISTAEKNFFK